MGSKLTKYKEFKPIWAYKSFDVTWQDDEHVTITANLGPDPNGSTESTTVNLD